ncbi:hypothetical protein LXL04_037767 [Taraxacum kok-saghyz]
MDSESPEQAPSQSHSSVQSNVRTKTDIGWDYATLVIDAKGKKSCICNFCNKVICGGGINRVKKHLAGYKGEVVACPKVPSDVRFTIQGNLKETAQKDKDEAAFIISDEDEDMEETLRRNVKARSVKAGKRKATSNVHPFFSKTVNDGAQPTIKSAMQSKAKLHDVDLAIAMFFYDACVPTNACNSPYYQHMVDKIAGIGHGYKAPNYHSLRVKLLGDAKKSVSLLIDSFRDQWVETGCTIMSDGWRDIRQRHLINFLIDKKAFDPIDYENIDKTDFWVIQEEPEGDLDYNELEDMLQEHEPASQSQETGSVNVDEVDTEFQLLSDRVIDAYNTPMSEIP